MATAKTPKSKKSVDAGDLSEHAWKMINEALTVGTMTTLGGKTITLDNKDFVRVVQWLAQQRAKKPKIVASAEDFALVETEQ